VSPFAIFDRCGRFGRSDATPPVNQTLQSGGLLLHNRFCARAGARLIWHATFDRSAPAFDNPDHVAIVIHNYRWRIGLAEGEVKYDELPSPNGHPLATFLR
jgi:hypothetical protein